MIDRPAFYLDVQRCTGCKTCMIACRDKNNLGPGIRWRRVVEFCGGDWRVAADGTVRQDVFVYYLSISCNHCQDPICVQVCPTTAMHLDVHGIVSVDAGKCVGCRYCEWACPYSAPQYDAGSGQVGKCDFCKDRLQAGKTPACVSACPTRALQFGSLEELTARYGDSALIAPLPPAETTRPNLLVGNHKNAMPINSEGGLIVNPEEVKDA